MDTTQLAPEQELPAKGTAAARYTIMENERKPYLDRARLMASLTIPTLYPPQDFGPNDDIKDPCQSIGARGINTLSAKFLLAIIPPNTNFFRYVLDAAVRAQAEQNPELLQEIEAGLAAYENESLKEIERCQLRPAMSTALKHFVLGNVCLHIPNKGSVRYFPLSNYVCRRDGRGDVLIIITKERVAFGTLQPADQEKIKSSLTPGQEAIMDFDDSIVVYTVVERKENSWSVHQEAHDVRLTGDGTYPLDDPQYLALRFTRLDGEHYGRGLVEDYAGDLWLIEKLSEALGEGSLASAKVLFGIKPSANVTPKELENKKNGGFFIGTEGDAWCLQVNKQADLSVAANTIRTLRQELSLVFLMNTSVQRDAERVTAQEIQYVAKELEEALGGVYSLLSDEFQRPLIKRMSVRVKMANPAFAQIKDTDIHPTIVTGLEALGRNAELGRLQGALSLAVQTLGPENVIKALNIDAVLKTILVAAGVPTKEVLKTPEQMQAEQQAAAQQQMMQAVAPEATKQIGNAVGQHLANQSPSRSNA